MSSTSGATTRPQRRLIFAMRLQRRLTLAFVLLAVVPLATAGVVLTRAGYETAFELKLAEQRQAASLTADEIEEHVGGIVRELQMLARMRGLGALPADEQHAALAALLAWGGRFADLAWLDAEGVERAHVSLHRTYGADDLRSRADLPEFQSPRASETAAFGPVIIDPVGGEPVMTVSVPELAPQGGGITGVLVAQVRLKRMWEVVARPHALNHLLYITDPGGLVLAHPDPAVVMRGTRVALPPQDGLVPGLSGETVLAARVPLLAGARELVVVEEQPLRAALALPLQTGITTVLIITGALAAALALAVLASRSIIRPIQRLAEVAGRISSGDLTQRADGADRPDEIGDLARSFNGMTARLVESVATLEARVGERTRALSTVQARLTEAIESISEGFLLCDENDDVVLANHRFRDFYPEIAHLAQEGRPFRRLVETAARLGLANDVTEADAWLAERLRLRQNQIPHVQHLTSGRWLLINERRTTGGQMVAIYTDITDLKAGEDELRQAKAQAESAAQAKSDFLAAMSHELRTPLNAIIGFSDTMRSGVFGALGNPRYREYAEDIFQSGQHLLSLINDILDVSKIEAGAMTVDMDTVALGGVIERALAMVRDAAAASRLALEVAVAPDLPPVAGDERRLLQVLLNLLSNAVKFTPEGGRVTISATAEADWVEMRVADTGVGIAAADIPRALEAFGQIDSSRSRRHPGSGLGLPLSRKLVELHGGSLAVESALGVGTTVIVRLPQAGRVHSE